MRTLSASSTTQWRCLWLFGTSTIRCKGRIKRCEEIRNRSKSSRINSSNIRALIKISHRHHSRASSRSRIARDLLLSLMRQLKSREWSLLPLQLSKVRVLKQTMASCGHRSSRRVRWLHHLSKLRLRLILRHFVLRKNVQWLLKEPSLTKCSLSVTKYSNNLVALPSRSKRRKNGTRWSRKRKEMQLGTVAIVLTLRRSPQP